MANTNRPRRSPEDIARRQAVGQRIKGILDERRMDVTELARLTGITRQQIHRIISGEYTMLFTTLEKIERVLGVSLTETHSHDVNVSDQEQKYLLMLRQVESTNPQQHKQLVRRLALAYAGLDDDDLGP